MTPGSEDPLRDGVGGGPGGGIPPLGRCGSILGRLYPQAGRGARKVLEAGAPGRPRAHPACLAHSGRVALFRWDPHPLSALSADHPADINSPSPHLPSAPGGDWGPGPPRTGWSPG